MEAIKLFFQVGLGGRERVSTLSPAETSYMGAANGPFIVSAPSGSSRPAAFCRHATWELSGEGRHAFLSAAAPYIWWSRYYASRPGSPVLQSFTNEQDEVEKASEAVKPADKEKGEQVVSVLDEEVKPPSPKERFYEKVKSPSLLVRS